MKIIHITLFVFLLSFIQTEAQQKKENYKFSEDIEAKLKSDTVPWKGQLAATNYSISGNYKKALQAWDNSIGARVQTLTAADSSYFKQFKPQDAKKYILDRSKRERLIIINEAHNNSRHRVFTSSLLKGLYKNGYHFLGVEALDDTLINQRKFPTTDSGSLYILESQYSILIKEALDIGFTLFNYEAIKGRGKEREIEQAKNIAKVMAENPDSKFLIHCGYDHLNEGTPGIKEWEKAMARRVNDLTGINPFTIDQIPGSEKGYLEFNSPYIKLANAKEPVIMVNAKGKTYNGAIDDDKADCRIIYPVTTYINGRANWLKIEGRKTYAIPTATIAEFPVFVMAYRKNEFENDGIPADIVELENVEQKSVLILDKGMYRIIVKDKNYKIIQDYEKKI